MKSYFLSIPQKFANVSHTIDAKAVLSNKSWTVFNDEGLKQIFIFQTDGKLIISTSGKVIYSTWTYLDANRSIIIENGDDVRMFHPAFSDDVLLILQQDGTQESLVMIDEANAVSFAPKTLLELKEYIISKELAYLRAQEDSKRLQEVSVAEYNKYKKVREEERAELLTSLMEIVKSSFNDFFSIHESKRLQKSICLTLLSIGILGIIACIITHTSFSIDWTYILLDCFLFIPIVLSLIMYLLSGPFDGKIEMSKLAIKLLKEKDFPLNDYDYQKAIIESEIVGIFNHVMSARRHPRCN